MSYIQPQAIQAIAHSVDIPRLADDAAAALAPDVEYRLREVVQEALKFAKHSKRQKLTTDDINNALQLRNVQPLYGFGNQDPAKFLKAAGHQDLFYVRDRELNFGQLIEAPLPPLPREPGISAHWLFVNGQQPAIPENTPLEQPPPAKRARHERGSAGSGDAAAANKGASGAAAAASRSLLPHAPEAAVLRSAAGNAAQVQLPVRHLLSKELQVYFDKIVSLVESPEEAAAQLSSPGAAVAAPSKVAFKASNDAEQHKQQEDQQRQQERQRQQGQELLKAALASLSSDPGLHPLAPYFTAFMANGVMQHIGDLPRLSRLLALARVLLLNPAIHMEHYLQQLMPAVMTCLLTKSLGAHASEDHWSIRDQAAAIIALACDQFGEPYHNVAPRVWRTLLKTFLDDSKGFTSKYGAVAGLQALGPHVVRTLLLPHLEPFVTSTLLPAMAGEAGELPRHNAWRVHAALLAAVGGAMYELLIGMMAERLPEELLVQRGPHPRKFDWERLQALAGGAVAQVPAKSTHEAQPEGAEAAGASGQTSGPAAEAGKPAEGGEAAAAAAAPAQQQQQQQQQGTAKQEGTAAPGAGAANGTSSAADGPKGAASGSAAVPGGSNGSAAHGTTAGGTPMDVDGPSVPTAGGEQQQDQQQAQQGEQQDGQMHVPSDGKGSSKHDQVTSSKHAQGPAVDVHAILADSWKEDSDVNAVLGALLALFGDGLLAYLPQAELPVFFL